MIKTGTYRARRKEMRSRRVRREAIWWLLFGVAAMIAFYGAVLLGARGIRDLSAWWRVRQEEAAIRRQPQTYSFALIGADMAKAPKVALGLAAIQVVPVEGKMRGVAIPGDTFVEVPGAGFERAAESLRLGPQTTVATIQNLLGIPLEHYVLVDMRDYKAVTERGISSTLFSKVRATDMPSDLRARLALTATKVKPGDALVVPMPVKAISLGDEVFYEVQKAEIADVLKSWWGVAQGLDKQPLRVKVLNGVGTPGVAGEAAKRLIKAGYRVIDTTNASTFGVGRTRILVFHGQTAEAKRIRKLLGAGTIVATDRAQDVVDIEVIIGKDYRPGRVRGSADETRTPSRNG